MESEIYNLDEELSNFAKVWLSVFLSLIFSHLVARTTSNSFLRLLFFIPIISLFLLLPLRLHSLHLGGTTAFFIAWLANFKLLLLAFHNGPLSDPSLSLPQFVAIGSFPIKLRRDQDQNPPLETEGAVNSRFKQKPLPKTQNLPNSSPTNGHLKGNPHPTSKNPHTNDRYTKTEEPKSSTNGQLKENPRMRVAGKSQKPLWTYAFKALVVGVLVRVYDFSNQIHPKVLMALYCLHIYFMLEIMLAMVAALARAALGMELEPQFDEPYASTSLQDFWGRRWNLMVTRILRPSVYNPTLNLASQVFARTWAPLPAVFATFVVSGLMHEIIFYCLGRTWPTWEITWFFLLHGVSLVVEIGVKKLMTGRCQLPPSASTPLSIGYVMVTAFWLFFPPLLRCDAIHRAVHEYESLVRFARDVIDWVVGH